MGNIDFLFFEKAGIRLCRPNRDAYFFGFFFSPVTYPRGVTVPLVIMRAQKKKEYHIGCMYMGAINWGLKG